jgi:hypothetical protein
MVGMTLTGLTSSWSTSRRRLLVSLALAAALTVALVGIVVVKGSGSAGTEASLASASSNFPPFVMISELIIEGRVVNTLHLDYQAIDSWKETVLASKDDSRVGLSQETQDGKYTVVVHGQARESDEPNDGSIHIPGPWFGSQDWVIGRGKGDGVTYTVGSADGNPTVQLTNILGTDEYVFDKATGIPLEYRTIVDGKTVTERRAISLVLGTGEKIR